MMGNPHPAKLPPAQVVSVPEPVAASAAVAPQIQNGGKDVNAPLPGVIIAIQVKAGDAVSTGQELCTLEAMKMKNAIRANREGTIAAIEVTVGDQVNHGQILMSFRE